VNIETVRAADMLVISWNVNIETVSAVDMLVIVFEKAAVNVAFLSVGLSMHTPFLSSVLFVRSQSAHLMCSTK